MMSSSSLFRIIASLAVAVAALGAAAAALWLGRPSLALAAMGAAAPAVLAAGYSTWRVRATLAGIGMVCAEIAKGNFEARVLHVREGGKSAPCNMRSTT